MFCEVSLLFTEVHLIVKDSIQYTCVEPWLSLHAKI